MANKNQKTISVVTDEENPIAVELVADAIISISDSIKKINSSRLNRKALLLLISSNCKPVRRGSVQLTVTQSMVDKVLDSIDSLKSAYLKDIPRK